MTNFLLVLDVTHSIAFDTGSGGRFLGTSSKLRETGLVGLVSLHM
jgi:hypothetical protein